MSMCLMAGAVAIALADPGRFTLEWTHSVERQTWRETWEVTPDRRLHLVEAAVKGSGAGMEPGEGGRFQDGWWVWEPTVPPVPSLALAASGETPSAWSLCSDGCIQFGTTSSDPIIVEPCQPE